jgi:hypothetical protein
MVISAPAGRRVRDLSAVLDAARDEVIPADEKPDTVEGRVDLSTHKRIEHRIENRSDFLLTA